MRPRSSNGAASPLTCSRRLLLAGLLFYLLQPGHAGQSLSVVTEHAPPYHYLNQDGEVDGSTTRFIRRILDEAAIDYRVTVYPWARAYKIASSQPNVLIFPIVRDPSREQAFHWFCPISEPDALFLYKLASNTGAAPRTLDELDKHVIGVIKNDFRHQQLLKRGLKTHRQLDESAYAEVNVKKLLNNRVDFVISTEREIANLMAGLGQPLALVEQSLLVEDFREQQLCMALSKASHDRIYRQVLRAFSQIRQGDVRNR